ncbi:hypothetical protein BD769DRAFT_1388418 [Suillus cothurnatus]|nr:hypothetical protein BD769DRAFT_1388418 [Suillus cothurnatus]
MSIPDSEVQCFSQRAANGIYDRVADAMTKLGKDGLGEADFGIDWCTTVQDNYSGTNWSYVNTKDGRPFKTNIVGQIATSTCGTRHSAKGTHFTKKARSTPLTQLIFGLTLAIKEYIWENQLTSIEDWVTDEKKRVARESKINSCTVKSNKDLQYADLIILTSQRIYEESMAGQQATSTATTSIVNRTETVDIPLPTADEVFQGALYDPRILPDYRGSYFELRQNKLKQLNIFDTPENNCKLVPMHETYAKLRPGTLVLAVCDAHVYNIVQNGLPTSTFQLGVQAIKILDPSDEPVEERLIPILSPTSTDMSKDNSAVVSFSTFDVAASPTKKAKHAKGGKGKEKNGLIRVSASQMTCNQESTCNRIDARHGSGKSDRSGLCRMRPFALLQITLQAVIIYSRYRKGLIAMLSTVFELLKTSDDQCAFIFSEEMNTALESGGDCTVYNESPSILATSALYDDHAEFNRIANLIKDDLATSVVYAESLQLAQDLVHFAFSRERRG